MEQSVNQFVAEIVGAETYARLAEALAGESVRFPARGTALAAQRRVRVGALMALGYSTADIAQRLGLTVRRVQQLAAEHVTPASSRVPTFDLSNAGPYRVDVRTADNGHVHIDLHARSEVGTA